jgi:hypothetical protein
MVDAMISPFRMPDLARRGRFRSVRGRFTAPHRASRPSGCDGVGSSRTVGDLMASTI